MDDILPVISRIVHVTTAIVVVGGTAFLRLVLMPSASAALSEEEHGRLRQRLIAVWKRFIHAGIGLFLVSGLYNYWLAILAIRASGARDPLYHGMLGTKILLAFVIFFIASALVGRSARFEGMRKSAGFWLSVNLAIALVIVGMSGYLKVRGRLVPPPAPAMFETSLGEATPTPGN
jgi:uncharacterized membrane protein